MKNLLIFVGLLCLSAPSVSDAQVLLSEIAWMGTDSNASHEWIEVYNFSTSPTDLTGWTITSEDGNLSIVLSGIIEPHGVGLLERDTDDVMPGIAALLTYSGEMVDAGGNLTLKNPGGIVMDQANGGTNWSNIGGTNTTPKKTAQRTRTGTWVTAAPTPGLENAQEDDIVAEPESSTPTPDTTKKTRSSGGGSSGKIDSVSIIAPTVTHVGKPNTFEADLSGLFRSPVYNWNFGDMETGEGETLTHSFSFPGEYVVIVEASTTKKHLIARHEIVVLPSPLALFETESGDVTIKNTSENELTLDGFTLSGDEFLFVFPKHSYIKPTAIVTLASEKITDVREIQIMHSDGYVIDSLLREHNAQEQNVDEMTTLSPMSAKTDAQATDVNPVVARTAKETDIPRTQGLFGFATSKSSKGLFGFATQ